MALLALVVALAAAAPLPARAAVVQLVDEHGTLHVTNVPGDPRYRRAYGAPSSGRGPAGPDRSAARYAHLIQELATRHGVNPALVEAVIRIESGFDPHAVSPKGAAGLMQLMPRTAEMLRVPDPFDPRGNVSGGVRHLRRLLDRYRGDVALALAAYNAGEGAVDAHRGVPPYPETVRYVRRVLQHRDLPPRAPR
jgi:soluble lytic murein transglycosylase